RPGDDAVGQSLRVQGLVAADCALGKVRVHREPEFRGLLVDNAEASAEVAGDAGRGLFAVAGSENGPLFGRPELRVPESELDRSLLDGAGRLAEVAGDLARDLAGFAEPVAYELVHRRRPGQRPPDAQLGGAAADRLAGALQLGGDRRGGQALGP